MFNLYRFYLFFRAILAILFIAYSLSSPLNANQNQSNLPHLKQKLPHYFDDPHDGIVDEKLNHQAHLLWQEIRQHGFAIRTNQSDKAVRTVFSQIQAHLEREMLALIPTRESGATNSAIWIMHTPLIATPMVTHGEVSPQLIVKEVLSDKDNTRLKTSLSRATLIREFLKKGGILIISYAKESPHQKKRAPVQMAIFEELKRAYPAQIIEFGIDSKHLPRGTYPLDKIGATYFTPTPNGDWLEVTNQGVQINDSHANATWGVWLQERHAPNTVVTRRLTHIIDFLVQLGLQTAMENHAKLHGIALDEAISFFSGYSREAFR